MGQPGDTAQQNAGINHPDGHSDVVVLSPPSPFRPELRLADAARGDLVDSPLRRLCNDPAPDSSGVVPLRADREIDLRSTPVAASAANPITRDKEVCS